MRRIITIAVVSLLLPAVVSVSSAYAETLSPWWHLSSATSPTYLQHGKEGVIVVSAVNLGDAAANPVTQPITLKDTLPAGLTPVAIEGTVDESISAFGTLAFPLECSLKERSCAFSETSPPAWGTRPYPSNVPPYYEIQMRITVDVKGAKSGAVNEASITGGEAPSATAREPLTVSDQPVPFGVSSYEMRPEEAGGGSDTHAGSHPFQLTTGLTISDATIGKPVALAKDLHFKLPPGLIGNPTPFAQCTLGQFLALPTQLCSAQTVVGVARVNVRLHYTGVYAVIPFTLPLYNLEPAVGEPARFGFVVNGEVPVLLNTAVRTGTDYGVTVSVSNISELAEFLSSEVTFWGVPGDPRHDQSRGVCLDAAYYNGAKVNPGGLTCPPFEANHPPPLLSLPTSCSGPMLSTLEGDSWLQPEPRVVARLASTELPGLDGCNRLPFVPRIEVSPDGAAGE